MGKIIFMGSEKIVKNPRPEDVALIGPQRGPYRI